MAICRYVLAVGISLTLAFVSSASNDSPGCPDIKFIGCLFRLRAQRVPFEKNMMNVVFGVKSEARLMHTCKAYSETMPCFRDKILECGNQKQKKLLHEVSRLLMFMCSPFSVPRQKSLVKHQRCIGNILKMPATTGCTPEPFLQQQLQACRTHCATQPSDFICIMKTWVTEQNLCTLADINSKCGAEAAKFYTDLQVTVFEPMFPVLCELPVNYQVITTTTALPSLVAAPLAPAHSTLSQVKFSRRISSENRNKTANELSVPNVQWNGMPLVVTTKQSELIPLRENFPAQKIAFATFLSNVFPANVTERFMAYNYSSAPAKVTNRNDRMVTIRKQKVLLSPSQDFSVPEPSIVSARNAAITRFIPAPTTTAVPIRVFSAKQRLSQRSYLSWQQRSATASNIGDTTRRWKPWYLGGENSLNEESKRKLPLYHGLK